MLRRVLRPSRQHYALYSSKWAWLKVRLDPLGTLIDSRRISYRTSPKASSAHENYRNDDYLRSNDVQGFLIIATQTFQVLAFREGAL